MNSVYSKIKENNVATDKERKSLTSNCLIITGFHHSGLSFIAKTLQEAGLYLGERLIGEDITSPSGYHEDSDIAELHDEILRENDTGWQYDGNSKLSVSNASLERMKMIAHKRRSPSSLWGFEDPRACLFLNSWEKVIPNLKVLVIYRHYSYCLHSLFKFHAHINMLNPKLFSSYNTNHKLWLNLELGLRMWLAYNKNLLSYARSSQDSVLFLPHQAIKHGCDVVTLVNKAFGFKLAKNNPQAFEKQSTGTEDLPAYLDQSKVSIDLLQEMSKVWQELNEWSKEEFEFTEKTFLTSPNFLLHELLSKYFPEHKIKDLETPKLEGVGQIDIETELSVSLLLETAKTQLQQENSKTVVRMVEMGLCKYPLEPWLYIYLGKAMMQLQNFKAAVAAFNQAIAINPNFPEFYLSLAEAHFKSNQYREAEFFAEQVLARNYKNIDSYCLLIGLSLKTKHWERAEEFIQKAKEIDGQDQHLLSLVATYYEEVGNIAKATSVAEEGCQLYPQNATLHQVLYRIYAEKGCRDKAEKSYNSYVSSVVNAEGYPQKLVNMLDSIEDDGARASMISYLYKELEMGMDDLGSGLGSNFDIDQKHYRSYVGPPKDYDLIAAMTFNLLTTLCLRQHHSLLDVGCGSLRVGRLLIPYLNAGNYTGIDPNSWLVKEGIQKEVGDYLINKKKVRFSFTDSLVELDKSDLFDFAVAQSIFSHCGQDLIKKWLKDISNHLKPTGALLATFVLGKENFQGEGWIYPELVRYDLETMQRLSNEANLTFEFLEWKHPRQSWALFSKPEFDKSWFKDKLLTWNTSLDHMVYETRN